MKLTAVGSGYYKVKLNGVIVSSHTTEREAIEVSVNLELANPADVVEYFHDYAVTVEDETYVPPDTSPPTALINLSDTALTAGETASLTISFSEPVSDFRLDVGNATAGALVSDDGGLTWTGTLTPFDNISSETNVVTVSLYFDIAGNAGAPVSSENYTVNTVPAPSTFPAWRQGLAPNVFAAIPGSAPSATLPMTAGLFDGYSGFAADVETGWIYQAGGGGHASGSDANWVVGVGLMQNVPAWSVIRASSGQDAGAADADYFPDGRPCGAHLYYSSILINDAGRKGILRVRPGNPGNAGTAPIGMDCFWLDVNDWDFNGVGWPGYLTGLSGFVQAHCIDPVTNKIYVSDTTSTFQTFDVATRTWSTRSSTGNSWGLGYCASIVIPGTPSRIIGDIGSWLNGSGGYVKGDHWDVQPVTGGAHTKVTLNWLTVKPPSFLNQTSFAYDSAINRIFWLSGTAVMRVNPDTWDCEYIADVQGPVSGVGTYNRLYYLPALEGIVYCARYGSEMIFMPTTLDPITPPEHMPKALINGIDQSLQTACDAGGTVTIGAGAVYTGATINVPGTSIVGAGLASTHLIGGVVGGKGQLVVKVDCSISGVSFEHAKGIEGNEAGIRHDSGKLTVADAQFLDCYNGYLGNADVDFFRSIWDGCGKGDGLTHGVYASSGAKLVTCTDGLFKNIKIGHAFKSRAERNVLTNNVMEPATESYSVDCPWGGVVEIDNLTATQGAGTDNPVLINYGSEVNPSPFATHSLSVSNSTLTSSGVANAIAIRIDAKTPVTAMLNNVHFVGFTTLVNGPAHYTGCTNNGVAIPDTI